MYVRGCDEGCGQRAAATQRARPAVDNKSEQVCSKNVRRRGDTSQPNSPNARARLLRTYKLALIYNTQRSPHPALSSTLRPRAPPPPRRVMYHAGRSTAPFASAYCTLCSNAAGSAAGAGGKKLRSGSSSSERARSANEARNDHARRWHARTAQSSPNGAWRRRAPPPPRAPRRTASPPPQPPAHTQARDIIRSARAVMPHAHTPWAAAPAPRACRPPPGRPAQARHASARRAPSCSR
jgi:hypothetical protein